MTGMQQTSAPPWVDLSLPHGDGAGVEPHVLAPAPSALEKALSVRAELRSKLDVAREKLLEIDAGRAELSYEAHTCGGSAERQLSKLNQNRVAHVAEIETLETAIIEASRRIADAERSEVLADEVTKAGRALEIGASLVERGRKLDEALAIIAAEAMAFQSDLRELNHTLGCTHPNEFQFQSNGERAVKAALMFSPFRIEHMAPRERRTFAELCDSWSAQITRWAEARLPKLEAAE